MIGFKSSTTIILLPIGLCVGLGLLFYNIYNAYYPSLTPEQALALSNLNEMYEICVKYSNYDGDRTKLYGDYLKCLNILRDESFVQALQSLECFYTNIDGAREDLLEGFISQYDSYIRTREGLNQMAHNMYVFSNHIKDIIDNINNNR